jgi:hypothetical protein
LKRGPKPKKQNVATKKRVAAAFARAIDNAFQALFRQDELP